MDERTRVLALSHVSYLTGERHDLEAYAALARDVGAMLVVDASHALGAVPVCAPVADFVLSCCYKWILGIQGTAIAYWNRERRPDWRPRLTGWHSVEPLPPLERHRGPQPLSTGRVFEPGNPPFIGLYVLENALQYLLRAGVEAIESHVLELSGAVHAGLMQLGLDIMTPAEPTRRAGNMCFATPHAREIRRALERRGVLVTGEDERVRISTHLYNDTRDVELGLAALGEVLESAATRTGNAMSPDV